MASNRFLISLRVTLFLVAVTVAAATSQPLVLNDSITVSIVEAINRNELALADRLLATQLAKDSLSLQWLFLRGMRHYTEIFTLVSLNKPALSALKQDMERVVSLGDERLERNAQDLSALFYTGGAYGYLGIVKTLEGSLLGGVGTAKKGYNLHEKLIELRPDCYDAYLGPGMMNLMTSAVPWILKPIVWLFGLSGTEEKAHEYLSLAYEKGTISRLEAGIYLAQLHDRRKDFEKSSQVYSQLVSKYPMRVALRAESLTPLWSDRKYRAIQLSARSAIDDFERRTYSYTVADSAWMPTILSSYSRVSKILRDTTSAIEVLEDYLRRYEVAPGGLWRVRMTLAETYIQRRDTLKLVAHYRSVLLGDAPDDTKTRVRDALKKYEPNN